MSLYHLKIKNGTSQLASAVKYYGYQLRDNKYTSSIFGRTHKQEKEEDYEEGINYVLDYGNNNITYKNHLIRIRIEKVGLVCDEYAHTQVFPTEVDIYLENVDPELKKDENLEEHEFYHKIIDEFIRDSKEYYHEKVLDLETRNNKLITIHMFDEYWETLCRREPRKIDTVHLDGMERETLEYIKKFLLPETKKSYKEKGIPYKKNILMEGYPGTGKTSLIFALASELKYNVAFLNFNKDVDDNAFMRAIRRLPKKSILVLEDIDVLFKERKTNDSFKNIISFSALLNTLDGLAFKQDMITIMTTNYECNLDSALKRPGRVDKVIHFDFAKESQVRNMFSKFFPDNIEQFKEFYKLIKRMKFTTAILQQYFIWHMENTYEDLIKEENINEFKELCGKNNYDKKLDLYS